VFAFVLVLNLSAKEPKMNAVRFCRARQVMAVAAVAVCSMLIGPTVARAQQGNVVELAKEAGQFNTLIAAAKAAGLVPALTGQGPLTVFAPTDAAFDKLPAGTVESLLKPENRSKLQSILKFHVVSGRVTAGEAATAGVADTLQGQRAEFAVKDGTLTVEGVTVVAANIRASNGVIHVVDEVLMPAGDDLVATAKSADFTTLVAAVQAAGLVEALQGDGPFTVFAPTDAAFEKLPDGTVESLLKPENRGKLQAILKYHVVPGRVYASTAIDGANAETLQGSAVMARYRDGQLRVNGARVVATDVEASNGVVHVIDRVLMPGGEAEVMGMIDKAIAVGAPAYNRGNVHRCVRVYRDTLRQLAKHDAMSDRMAEFVSDELEAGQRMHDESDVAWKYRRVLDRVYMSMSESMYRGDEMAEPMSTTVN